MTIAIAIAMMMAMVTIMVIGMLMVMVLAMAMVTDQTYCSLLLQIRGILHNSRSATSDHIFCLHIGFSTAKPTDWIVWIYGQHWKERLEMDLNADRKLFVFPCSCYWAVSSQKVLSKMYLIDYVWSTTTKYILSVKILWWKMYPRLCIKRI